MPMTKEYSVHFQVSGKWKFGYCVWWILSRSLASKARWLNTTTKSLATFAQNPSLEETWHVTCTPTMQKSHLIAQSVEKHSRKIIIWRFTCSSTTGRRISSAKYATFPAARPQIWKITWHQHIQMGTTKEDATVATIQATANKICNITWARSMMKNLKGWKWRRMSIPESTTCLKRISRWMKTSRKRWKTSTWSWKWRWRMSRLGR